MRAQHFHQRVGRTTAFVLRIMRLDQGDQAQPRHHLIHLDQEQLLAGLIALVGVLGVSEAHFLIVKVGQWDRRTSPDLGSLFQDFPNDPAITRLVGAMLLEQNDEWCLQRRYMQLEAFEAVSDNPQAKLSAVIN